jgi:hypothetical protein
MDPCIFCFELKGDLKSICDQCSVCSDCVKEYSDLLLCCHQTPIIIPRDTKAPTYHELKDLFHQIFDRKDTYERCLKEGLRAEEESYLQHIANLKENLEKHTLYLDPETRESRHQALLKELTEKNAPIYKEYNMYVENVQELIKVYGRALKEFGASLPLDQMGSWYNQWVNIKECEKLLPFKVSVSFYQVYFYHEESPVDINKIGCIYRSDEIWAGVNNIRVYKNGKTNGRCQEILEDGSIKDIVYDNGDRVTCFWKFKDETGWNYAYCQYENNLVFRHVFYDENFKYRVIVFKYLDGYIEIRNTESNDERKSGFYVNNQLVCDLDKIMERYVKEE